MPDNWAVLARRRVEARVAAKILVFSVATPDIAVAEAIGGKMTL